VIHLDTSFLVDLLREQRRGSPRSASAWLAQRPDERLAASLFVLCELEAGAALAVHPARERARLAQVVEALTIVAPGEDFASRYGTTLVHIQRQSRSIATMDLLIATTALVDGAPLLTANVKHFEAVPDLTLVTYR
jgi:predicted nucleic acid-binding protein